MGEARHAKPPRAICLSWQSYGVMYVLADSRLPSGDIKVAYPCCQWTADFGSSHYALTAHAWPYGSGTERRPFRHIQSVLLFAALRATGTVCMECRESAPCTIYTCLCTGNLLCRLQTGVGIRRDSHGHCFTPLGVGWLETIMTDP